MTVPDHIRRVDAELRCTADLMRLGATARSLANNVRTKKLIKVTRGWYVAADRWSTWHPESRHLAAVLAAHRDAIEPPLFSHHSAAVLLGLPLWGLGNEVVHTISATTSARRSSVVRHRLKAAEADTGTVAGIRCTNHDRTLFDLCRVASEEMVVGCADSILRRRLRRGRSIDVDAWLAWKEQMSTVARRSDGARGIRLFRRMIEFADPRADSPLESISRLYLDRLGFEVELQISVANPNGGHYFVDFRFLGLGILGEADGDVKYTDATMLGNLTPGEAALREKKRDNWISGRTGERMIHWGAREAATTATFAAMLRAFNVPTRRRPS